MSRNRYTPGERAIAEIGAQAGIPLEEVNRLLAEDARANGREPKLMPKGTYDQLVQGQRRQLFDRDPDSAWGNIEHPLTRTEVSQRLAGDGA
jgi:hypothetical protein